MDKVILTVIGGILVIVGEVLKNSEGKGDE